MDYPFNLRYVYTPSTPRKNCAHVYSKHFPAQMKREYRYVILRLMSPIQYKEGGNSVLQKKKKTIRKAKRHLHILI